MHSVFWSAKRAYLATTRYFGDVLRRFELTPARYDLLLYIREKDGRLQTQSELRAAFGVSRATMSEALRGLARLGLVTRMRAGSDGRTFYIELTAAGRAAVQTAARGTRGLVRRLLARMFREPREIIMQMHDAIDRNATVRRIFGDTAVPELKWIWHPDA